MLTAAAELGIRLYTGKLEFQTMDYPLTKATTSATVTARPTLAIDRPLTMDANQATSRNSLHMTGLRCHRAPPTTICTISDGEVRAYLRKVPM